MLRTVANDKSRALTIARKSPFTSVRCALLIATSVPVPIAMPTWALARAGASLMPSPAMATTLPSFCRRSTSASLPCGVTSPNTSSMPSWRATERAVLRPSPVAMMTVSPARLNAASAAGVVALIGSETAIRPINWRSAARNITLAPPRRSASACAFSTIKATPSSAISAVLPSARRCPATRPRTPIPLDDSNLSGFMSARPRLSASATIACASGCSLPWSMLAAIVNTCSSVNPGAVTIRSNAGRPSVRVPVLSTTRVSTLHIDSMAAASRNSMPCVAARPVAAMIDIGVASPSAHGQAMINTDTALTKPSTQPGSGPKMPQPNKVSSAMPITTTTK